MGDDMGYSDIGCYGGEIHTPHLDRLAAEGVRFSQFYNGARCCPTRASLLTGLYAHQTGVGHMLGNQGLDGYQTGLNRKCVTIAEALSGNGYHTYMSGKWHVTTTLPLKAQKTTGRCNVVLKNFTEPSLAQGAFTIQTPCVAKTLTSRQSTTPTISRKVTITPMPSPTMPSLFSRNMSNQRQRNLFSLCLIHGSTLAHACFT